MLMKFTSPVALYDAFLEAKVSRETATRVADSLSTDILELQKDLATKQDLEMLRTATKQDLEMLRTATKQDLEMLRTATKQDLEMLRKDVKHDIALFKTEVNGKFKLIYLLLGIVMVLSASSSPIFTGLTHLLGMTQ